MKIRRFRSALPSSLLVSLLALGIDGASLSLSRTAEAAASPADAAAAQSLFDESKKLMAAGQYASARPKLEESERLDPSPSTKFYLADCYQHLGQVASAWALYLEVASESKAAGRAEREQFARKRAEELAPKLSRLTVTVPAGADAAGLEIKRDGKLVGAGQWGTAVPVDPGKHTITATQPSHLDWSQTVDVAPGGKTATIEVPALAPAPVVAPVVAAKPQSTTPESTPAASSAVDSTSPAAETGDHRRATRRTIALVTGGVGVAALGVGGVFGGLAIAKNNQSMSGGCNGDLCNAAGLSLRQNAQSDATISDIVLGVGAAAVVAGVVLWVTAPSAHTSQSARLGLSFAPNGLFVNGVFE